LRFSPKKILARYAKLAELAFFPSFCKICGTLLESPGDRVVCRACLDKIRPCRLSSCVCCGRYFEGVGEDHLCGSCLREPPPFALHRSGGRYRDELKDVLLLFKYRRYRVLGKDLAALLYESQKREESLWWGVGAIVPVPLHKRRLKERGFNQACVLAGELGRLKGLPVEDGVLRKIENIPPQTSLERKERRNNVRGAYAVARPEKIAGRILLLVDDVFTTGSTIGECASVLKKAGAKEVRAVTIAQA